METNKKKVMESLAAYWGELHKLRTDIENLLSTVSDETLNAISEDAINNWRKREKLYKDVEIDVEYTGDGVRIIYGSYNGGEDYYILPWELLEPGAMEAYDREVNERVAREKAERSEVARKAASTRSTRKKEKELALLAELKAKYPDE